MSRHLTSEQLDTLLAGQTSPAMAEHLSTCADCAAEVDSMRLVMTDLRETSTLLAQRSPRPALHAATPDRSTPFLAWGVAFAALLIGLFALSLNRHHAAPQQAIEQPQQQKRSAASLSDEALLSSIQEDLNDSLPDAMAPLAATTTSSSTRSTDFISQRKN